MTHSRPGCKRIAEKVGEDWTPRKRLQTVPEEITECEDTGLEATALDSPSEKATGEVDAERTEEDTAGTENNHGNNLKDQVFEDGRHAVTTVEFEGPSGSDLTKNTETSNNIINDVDIRGHCTNSNVSCRYFMPFFRAAATNSGSTRAMRSGTIPLRLSQRILSCM
jgi:hypothetical protein